MNFVAAGLELCELSHFLVRFSNDCDIKSGLICGFLAGQCCVVAVNKSFHLRR